MKVIEILTKIANGEIPKKILIDDMLYTHDGVDYKRESDGQYLFTVFLETTTEDFNREVEIIEEENELHANSVEFNINNDKRDCIITLDENDLGIDKLHLDNCYFYKENGKWYVKKYDFKTINIEEDKKIEKIGTINYCENPVEMILHHKIDEIIDIISEMREDK